MTKIFVPNYTQVPNIVIDDLASVLSDAAFKIYVVLIRKTKGWEKARDSISVSQFMKITGKTKPTVIRAIDELINLELITHTGLTRYGNEYELNLTFSHAGVFVNFGGKKSLLVKNFYPPSKNFLLLGVKNFYPQKKLSKETTTKEILSNAVLEIFDYWKAVFKKNNSTKLEGIRETKIRARLNDGISKEDIMKAITNVSQDWWHVENNHIDLELICRNDVKIQQYINLKPKSQAERENTNRYSRSHYQPQPDPSMNRMENLKRLEQEYANGKPFNLFGD